MHGRGFAVHKKAWTRRGKNGQTVRGETAKWYVFYRDGYGKKREVPGFESYDLTVQLGHKLVAEANTIRLTGKPPAESPLCERFMPHEWLDKFERHLRAGDREGETVRLVMARLRVVMDGVNRLVDLTASHLEDVLARLKAERNASAQTRKHYIRNAKQFTRWLVRKKAMNSCPLADVEVPAVKKDRRHVRRAERPEFLTTLYASMTERNKSIRHLTAEDRVWLYVVAAATGYRAKELSRLVPADFLLDLADPVVVLPGGRTTKNAEPTVQPIDPALVPGLAAFLAKKKAGQPVWPGKWRTGKWAGQMLKRDLAAAGLPYKDHRGRVFDFHSLRATYITALALSGAPFSDVQRLARHSDPKLTMDVYVDNGITQLAGSVRKIGLPVPPAV